MRTFLNIMLGIVIGVFLERAGVPLDHYWPFKYWTKKSTASSSALSSKAVSPARPSVSSRLPNVKASPLPPPSPAKRSKTPSLYTVQIASFKTLRQAKAFMNTVTQKQIDAYLAPLTEESPRWYRIYVGEYVNKADAIKKLTQLRRDFPKAFLRGF